MSEKKKLKLRKEIIIGVGVVIILLILFAIYNLTVEKVKKQDKVSVNYIGTLDDGIVFDTNIQEVALKNNLQRNSFQPLDFTVGSGEVIKGFNDALIGMTKGDTKKIIVKPAEGYKYDDALIIRNIPLNLEIDRFLDIDIDSFNGLFGRKPVKGELIMNKDQPFPIKVVEITKEKIIVEVALNIGDKIILPGASWDSEVISAGSKVYAVKHNPKVGMSYVFLQSANPISGIVLNVNSDSFDVDTNHPLAGKSLNFEITLLEIKKV